MSEEENVVSQDDIDSLLEESQAEAEAEPAGEKNEAVEGEAVAEAVPAAEGKEGDGEQGGKAEQEPELEAQAEAVGEEAGANLEDPAAWGLSEEQVDKADQMDQEAAQVSPTPQPQTFSRQPNQQDGAPREIEFILDIPLQMRVEVGRTRVTIANLLSFGPGAVVELDKLAGEPLDIFINEKLVARGEAIITNEKFGIRLTEVVSKTERIENLS